MDKLATLQMEDAMQTGHHVLTYIPMSPQLLGHSLACLLTHETQSHTHSLALSPTHHSPTNSLTIPPTPLETATCLFVHQPCRNSSCTVYYRCLPALWDASSHALLVAMHETVEQGLTVKTTTSCDVAVGCSKGC